MNLTETRPRHRRFERHRPRDREGIARKGCQGRDHWPARGRCLRRRRGTAKEREEKTGIAADVGTAEGRAQTLQRALDALGGLDILVNNAGGVRAGRLEATTEAEIEAMLNVDLLAPILLTRAALPSLRASGDAMVVNVTSGIALIGAPFYATYAAAKAGLARFGEALRRELKGEGIHVLTVYPGATDTPMMKTNRAGPELGFGREPASAVADATIEASRPVRSKSSGAARPALR